MPPIQELLTAINFFSEIRAPGLALPPEAPSSFLSAVLLYHGGYHIPQLSYPKTLLSYELIPHLNTLIFLAYHVSFPSTYIFKIHQSEINTEIHCLDIPPKVCNLNILLSSVYLSSTNAFRSWFSSFSFFTLKEWICKINMKWWLFFNRINIARLFSVLHAVLQGELLLRFQKKELWEPNAFFVLHSANEHPWRLIIERYFWFSQCSETNVVK